MRWVCPVRDCACAAPASFSAGLRYGIGSCWAGAWSAMTPSTLAWSARVCSDGRTIPQALPARWPGSCAGGSWVFPPAWDGRPSWASCGCGWALPHSRVASSPRATGPPCASALLGVCLGGNSEQLSAYVRASTRLTHTDPRAERGAWLVARAAHLGATVGPAGVSVDAFMQSVNEGPWSPDAELQASLALLVHHVRRGHSAEKLAAALGLVRGVSGYVYHTVPIALYCWLRSPADFRAAVEEAILLGGDADTTAAITGAVAGATLGVQGIPRERRNGMLDWPRTSAWMSVLAERLAGAFATDPRSRDPRCRCSGQAFRRETCSSSLSCSCTLYAGFCRPTEVTVYRSRLRIDQRLLGSWAWPWKNWPRLWHLPHRHGTVDRGR